MIDVNQRKIGPGAPVYIIAEMSANHGQSYDHALRILEAAKAAGADAVKVQTYTPGSLTLDCDRECFQIQGTLWEGKHLHDLYGEAYMPWEWQPRLKEAAGRLGLDFFSTPFDATAVDFLEAMDVPAYKVASFEIVDLQLLARIAATGKPVLLSTGMASLAEIDEAVATLRRGGAGEIALFKCTSAYPALPAEMNLRTIPHLAAAFGVPVGLSDHTRGISAPVAAVALGASLVEKHFTLSRACGGPDSSFSLEPPEFKQMAAAVREAEAALGKVSYTLSAREEESRMFRRSLFVVEDMAAGEAFTPENVRSIRPGHGLHPRYLGTVLGRAARRAIPRGTPLDWADVGEEDA